MTLRELYSKLNNIKPFNRPLKYSKPSKMDEDEIIDLVPLERSTTFSSISSSVSRRLVEVAIDETNGGDTTLYYHDGTNLNWIPTQTV